MSTVGEGVDRAHLDQLGTRFGASFVAQLIDLFLEQAAGLLNAARAAVEVGDATAITAAAHALKSSAANVGARALSTLAADVERLGRQGSSAAVLAPHVGALAEELERAGAVLLALRGG
jgi:HPt (histidine-containing phosphotransfer) domain-containing protein